MESFHARPSTVTWRGHAEMPRDTPLASHGPPTITCPYLSLGVCPRLSRRVPSTKMAAAAAASHRIAAHLCTQKLGCRLFLITFAYPWTACRVRFVPAPVRRRM